MGRRKEPTIYEIRLLISTAYNDEGDILKVKAEDNENVYYYDTFHRWCYLEKFLEGKEWEYKDKK